MLDVAVRYFLSSIELVEHRVITSTFRAVRVAAVHGSRVLLDRSVTGLEVLALVITDDRHRVHELGVGLRHDRSRDRCNGIDVVHAQHAYDDLAIVAVCRNVALELRLDGVLVGDRFRMAERTVVIGKRLLHNINLVARVFVRFDKNENQILLVSHDITPDCLWLACLYRGNKSRAEARPAKASARSTRSRCSLRLWHAGRGS